jgi:hypothetical protein
MSRRNQSGDGATATLAEQPVKTAVTLSPDASRRLKTAMLVDQKSMSEIVDELCRKHLVGYFAGKRGATSSADQVPESGEDK